MLYLNTVKIVFKRESKMTSRHSTIQHKQLVAAGLQSCVVLAMQPWTPGSNISNLFERGYDPRGRVLEGAVI